MTDEEKAKRMLLLELFVWHYQRWRACPDQDPQIAANLDQFAEALIGVDDGEVFQ